MTRSGWGGIPPEHDPDPLAGVSCIEGLDDSARESAADGARYALHLGPAAHLHCLVWQASFAIKRLNLLQRLSQSTAHKHTSNLPQQSLHANRITTYNVYCHPHGQREKPGS